MSKQVDRQQDVRRTMQSVSELREVVETRTAPIRFWRGLLSLFLVARLGFAFVTVMFPDGGVLADSLDYLALADRFAGDGQYGVEASGQTAMLRPPGYPVLLAGIKLALGSETYWITLVQLLFSGLTSLVLVRLGIELQRPRAGLIAAWLYALSPNVLLWSLTVMSEVSFAMLLALTTLLIVRMVNSFKRWWPAGAGLGLAALAYLRPVALALTPIWGAVVYWYRQPRYGKRRALLAALVMVVLVALATLPWAYRNWQEYGSFSFSTAARVTWVGSNLAQLLGITRTLAGSDVATWASVLGADRWLGVGLLSGAFTGNLDDLLQALIRGEDPTAGARLAIHTVGLTYSIVLLLPAAFGALFARLDSDAGRLTRAMAISSVVMLLVLPGAAGEARYRVPAEPYLALLAGFGAGRVLDGIYLWLRRARRRSMAGGKP